MGNIQRTERRQQLYRSRPLTPEEQRVADLLNLAKGYRDDLGQVAKALGDYVLNHSQLQPAWEHFLASGGVEARDWMKIIYDPRPYVPVPSRRSEVGHVRLVPKLGMRYYALRECGDSCWYGASEAGEARMALTFRPKIDKIVELLLYLAHKRPGADKYQAIKLFYLADREHLRRYGRPMTFDNYYALWYGPVASNTLDLLNGASPALLGAKETTLPFRTEKGMVKTKSGKESETTFIREPSRPVNMDLLSKSDLQVFDEIMSEYGDFSFDDLFNETHKHFAYFNAWEHRRFGADRAEMFYDEMIDDEAKRAELVDDLAPIAARMK